MPLPRALLYCDKKRSLLIHHFLVSRLFASSARAILLPFPRYPLLLSLSPPPRYFVSQLIVPNRLPPYARFGLPHLHLLRLGSIVEWQHL